MGGRRSLAGIAALVALAGIAPSAAPAQPSASRMRTLDDEGVHTIIVRRRAGLSFAQRRAVRADAGVELVGALRLSGTELVRAPPGALADAVQALEADPDVVYAEPNGVVRTATNDVYFGDLWALSNTGQIVDGKIGTAGADTRALEAWTRTLGAGQTVGVADSGIDLAQPDLQGQLATNSGESGPGADGLDRATNGVDDDHNGVADDVRGWDWVDNDNVAQDTLGHGTHVAGIVAAIKDNSAGVVGIAPEARIVPLRMIGSDGFGTFAASASALDYAGDLGLAIVNGSFAADELSQAEAQAITDHPSTLYVLAAGNGGSNGVGDDLDADPVWPCALPAPNVICVGASTSTDKRAAFSNYGATSVDLFAPGSSIRSTWPNAQFLFRNGTSMATPYVSGALALMRAANPKLTAAQLKRVLLANVALGSAFAGRSTSGGRLDAAAAVEAAALTPPDVDDDGVPDAGDVCPSTADPQQLDTDHDGLGDACDPTPTGDPPPPPPPPPPAPPAPPPGGDGGDVHPASTAPRLTAVRLSVRTLVACRRGAPRGCRERAASLRFTLDRAVTLRARVERRVTVRGAVRWRTVGTLTWRASANANRLVVRPRVGGRTLSPGRYRLVVQAIDGALRSIARTLAITVR